MDADEEKKEPFLGLSWLQLITGSLAAMTSAWIASAFGLSGTIIGAAVGSLSASIATAFYMRSLTRGHEMVRRSNGDITADPSQALPAIDENIGSERTRTDAEVSTNGERRVWFSKKVLIGAVAGLIIAIGSIWAFEFVSGNPFGQAETPALGRPWQSAPEQTTTPPPPTPTPTPTQTATEPSPSPSTTEPTPTPTAPEPTAPTEPEPTPTATPSGATNTAE